MIAACRHEIDRVLAAHGVEPDVVMEFDNIETIKRAVEIDAGVALLPGPTVGREVAAGTIHAIPIDTDPPLVRPLGIIRVRGKPLPPTADRFLEFLRGHAAAESDAGPAPPLTRGRRPRPPVPAPS